MVTIVFTNVPHYLYYQLPPFAPTYTLISQQIQRRPPNSQFKDVPQIPKQIPKFPSSLQRPVLHWTGCKSPGKVVSACFSLNSAIRVKKTCGVLKVFYNLFEGHDISYCDKLGLESRKQCNPCQITRVETSQ